MDHSPDPVLDQLLTREPALRALAYALATDGAAADDALQDSWLAAIRRPPSSQRAVPWFGRVLRNALRRRRRGERRRRARELAVARPEEWAETPAALAEQAALQRDVAAAVAALPEAFREVVVLRYYHARSAAEIGRQLGLSHAAVRQRLKRARDHLREALDERYGGRRWLAPALAIPTGRGLLAGGSSFSLFGVVLMKKSLALVVAAVVMLSVLAALFHGSVGPPPTERGEVPETAVLGTAESPPRTSPPEASERGRSPIASDEHDERGTTQHGAVLVRAVWAGSGAPVEHELVTVRWWDGAGRPVDRTAFTGAGGEARIDGVPPGDVRVGLLRRGDAYAWPVVSPGDVAAVELDLQAELTIDGTVFDADDRPVPGAGIWVSEPWNRLRGHILVHTDADGAFRLSGIGRFGRNWLGARGPEAEPTGPAPTRVVSFDGGAPGDVAHVRFVLDRPGAALRGVVRDSEGHPIAGAEVLHGRESASWASGPGSPPTWGRTDGQGRFQLAGVTAGRAPLQVRAPGFAPHHGEVELTAGDAVDVVVHMKREPCVACTVVDPSGRRVAGAAVQTLEPGRFAGARARTDAEGVCELRGVATGAVQLVALHDELGEARCEATLTAGATFTWRAVLQPVPRVFGRVLDAAGSPVGGIEVALSPHPQRRRNVAYTQTASDGTFAFARCQARDHELVVHGREDEYPLLSLHGVRPSLAPLVLRLPDPESAFGVVTGRVVDSAGNPVADAWLMAAPEGSKKKNGRQVDADGSFSYRVPVGRIALSVHSEHHPVRALSTVGVSGGATTDLGTISLETAARVRGAVEGLPFTARASLDLCWLDDGEELDGGQVVGLRFTSPPLTGGHVTLVAQADFARRRVLELDLEPGEERFVKVPLERAGRREVALTVPRDEIRPTWIWCEAKNDEGEVVASRGAPPAPGGTTHLMLSAVPGTYRLVAGCSTGLRATTSFEINGWTGSDRPLELVLERK